MSVKRSRDSKEDVLLKAAKSVIRDHTLDFVDKVNTANGVLKLKRGTEDDKKDG